MTSFHIRFSDPRPKKVESVEQNNANDMFGNKNLPRKTPKFCTAYKKPVQPFLAHFTQSCIICKYSKKWDSLEEKYERKNEELERELTMEKEKLEDQLERELEKILLSKRIVSDYSLRETLFLFFFYKHIQIITFYTLQRSMWSRSRSKW